MSSMRLSPNATDSGEAVVTSTTGDAAADEPNVDPDFLMKLIQDSVKYLSAVKERLNVENRAHPESENTPKYEQFLTTLKDFKDRKYVISLQFTGTVFSKFIPSFGTGLTPTPPLLV